MENIERLKQISQYLSDLKTELLKERPQREVCLSLLLKSSSNVDEITKCLGQNTIHWAEQDLQKPNDESDEYIDKYGVAEMLGIAVKTVENRMRDARLGIHNFPMPATQASFPGIGGKPTHLWLTEDIENYKKKNHYNNLVYNGDTKFQRRKTRRQKQKIEITEDGLLTIHGVARMLNLSSLQVQYKLETARKDKTSLFPLPTIKRRIAGPIPSNLWKREDIDAYKQLIEQGR